MHKNNNGLAVKVEVNKKGFFKQKSKSLKSASVPTRDQWYTFISDYSIFLNPHQSSSTSLLLIPRHYY